jgi:threonine dehydratase
MPGTVEYTGVRIVEAPTLRDVESAERRIRTLLPPTPVAESDGFALKLETLQPTGSFKVRGALAALTALPPETPVVTASAGNAGLALAWAAHRLGMQATVVVAETASPVKVDAIRRFPATLVVYGKDYDAAERHGLSLPGHYASPYNDPDVIAGAGTIGLELADADTIVVPIGGGGLAAGIGLATRARMIGVVPEAFPAMRAALDAGRIVEIDGSPTIADGLHGNIEPGSVTFELVRDRLEDVVAVSEAELEDAMRFLAREHGLVVEGAGAAAVAALLAGKAKPRGATVAVLSGRNVTAATLARVLSA